MRARARQVVTAVVAIVLVVVAVQVVIRFSDGAYSGDYPLTASFARAGSGLQSGAEVVYRGVQVGRVTTIRLHDRRADVGMVIDPTFSVPASAVATVEPINVFGADQVALSFPHGGGGPHLAAGSSIGHTTVQPGLDSLFAAAAPLLSRIDTTDLSTVIATLAQAGQGEGPTIRASIDEGAKLAAFLDQTLPAQITALDATTGFAGALVPTASSINAISGSENQLLPTFNANSAAYRKLLATITPFADNLAQFLSAYHPDITTLLARGDDVARLLVTDQQDIGGLVSGLAVYEGKIGNAVDPAEVLPNGTSFGYFDAFLTVGDLNQLICSLLNPAVPGLSSILAPLQQALTGVGSPISCGSGAPPSAAQAAQNLSTALYGQAAAPAQGAAAGGPGTATGGAAAGGSPGAGGTGTSGSSGGGSSGSAGSGGSSGSGSSGSSGNALQQLLGGLL